MINPKLIQSVNEELLFEEILELSSDDSNIMTDIVSICHQVDVNHYKSCGESQIS